MEPRDASAAPDRSVGAVMTMDPVVIPVMATVATAAEILEAYRINGAPVIDDDGRIVGVVSQTDLVRLRAAGRAAGAWHAARVIDLMTSPPITIGIDASLRDAARAMIERGVHRLVVVDDAREPVGVVSESDIVRDIAESCDE
jgi:CBS domain-containing protein